MMNDLISRQAAIDEAKEWIDAVYFEENDKRERKAIECFIGSLKNMPSAQQWIPCSERLPEGGRVVLVTEKGGFIRHCEYANYCDFQEFQTVEEGLTVHDVIAWMPLPDPWKEKPNEIH